MRKKNRTGAFLLLAVLLAAALCLTSCGSPSAAAGTGKTEITMWVYPIGRFGDPETVNSFLDTFEQKYPDIHVTVDYLDYESGDDQVSAALSAGTAPDVVMEGPERIVSTWGAAGAMADLGDLWTEDTVKDVSQDGDTVVNACKSPDGVYYEYPLCKTAHCMAINYEVFEKAGALQYLDLTNRTWTTDGFQKACQAIAKSGLVDSPGVVYCGGQGGDQGTRALVTNLYGASFTNKEHTAYTINSAAGVKALRTLKSMTENGSLSYDADIQGSAAQNQFIAGDTAMTFAWNSSDAKNLSPEAGFTPYAMAFPTDGGQPQLCGGLWGFGVFANGNNAKIEASKTLIRFLCDDETQAKKSVQATGFFPVRASLGDVYSGTADELWMQDYRKMMDYVGDYYNVTPGWAAQRTVWWNMLQQVFSGTTPEKAANRYAAVSNRAIVGTVQQPAAQTSTQATHRVLFISSYSLSYPTVSDQIAGIREGLGDGVYLHCEFMDSSAVTGEDYVASYYRYICDKYSRVTGLDAIIVGDDNALQMVIRYQEGFFRDIPVIYETVNSQTLTALANSLGMTGVPAHNTIRDNLDLACKIYPNADRILAVSDESAVGRVRTSYLKAIKSLYAPKQVDVLDTSKLTRDEIVSQISEAGDNAIVLFLKFTNDVEGTTYLYEQALQLVTESAKSPVFTLAWMGKGSLGGISADYVTIGKSAGEMALSYIHGTIPIQKPDDQSQIATTAAFDVSVMNQYHVSKRALPSGAVYYNDMKASTRLLIVIGGLVAATLLLSLLLIRFGKENRRRKHRENELLETSDVLRTEAEKDELTGLGNRRLFDRELSRSITASRPFTLFIFDLDNFKLVNDGYGHLAGDQVLKETGARLNTVKCRTFVPYRYGGDEFAVMDFSDEPDAAESVSRKIRTLLCQNIETDGGSVAVTISLGSADFPDDAMDVESLIRCADQALYAVKTNGKNGAKRYKGLRSPE